MVLSVGRWWISVANGPEFRIYGMCSRTGLLACEILLCTCVRLPIPQNELKLLLGPFPVLLDVMCSNQSANVPICQSANPRGGAVLVLLEPLNWAMVLSIAITVKGSLAQMLDFVCTSSITGEPMKDTVDSLLRFERLQDILYAVLPTLHGLQISYILTWI